MAKPGFLKETPLNIDSPFFDLQLAGDPPIYIFACLMLTSRKADIRRADQGVKRAVFSGYNSHLRRLSDERQALLEGFSDENPTVAVNP